MAAADRRTRVRVVVEIMRGGYMTTRITINQNVMSRRMRSRLGPAWPRSLRDDLPVHGRAHYRATCPSAAGAGSPRPEARHENHAAAEAPRRPSDRDRDGR